MRYLTNNLKPATHFIEVFKDAHLVNAMNGQICNFSQFEDRIDFFAKYGNQYKTIAIFKIRSK